MSYDERWLIKQTFMAINEDSCLQLMCVSYFCRYCMSTDTRKVIDEHKTTIRRCVIISTFYLGEIANTNYKSNKELDSFSSFI